MAITDVYDEKDVTRLAAEATATTPGPWDMRIAFVKNDVEPTEADIEFVNKARFVVLKMAYTIEQLRSEIVAAGLRDTELVSGSVTLSMPSESDEFERFTYNVATRKIEREQAKVKSALDSGAISRDAALEQLRDLKALLVQVEDRYEASLPSITWSE